MHRRLCKFHFEGFWQLLTNVLCCINVGLFSGCSLALLTSFGILLKVAGDYNTATKDNYLRSIFPTFGHGISLCCPSFFYVSYFSAWVRRIMVNNLTLYECTHGILSWLKSANMAQQNAGADSAPHIHVRVECVLLEAKRHQLCIHLWVFTRFWASVSGSISSLHMPDNSGFWSNGDALEHAIYSIEMAIPLCGPVPLYDNSGKCTKFVMITESERPMTSGAWSGTVYLDTLSSCTAD